MTSDNIKSGVYLAAIAVAGYVIYKAVGTADAAGKAVSTAAATVGGWVNPTSDKNLAYSGVNAIGGAISGEKDWSLGGAIYDWTHTGQSAYVDALVNPTGYPSAVVSSAQLAEDKRVNGWSAWDTFGNYTAPAPAPLVSGGGGVFNGNGTSGSW